MKWNLVNPSDPYTVECDNFKCAAIAAIYLGEGQYALDPIEGTPAEFKMPIFLLGGHDEWFITMFGEGLEKSLHDCMLPQNVHHVIKALRSISIPDHKRSSLNNIGARAKVIADSLEEATCTDSQ